MARPKRTTPWLARRGDQNNGPYYAFWYDAEKRETKRLSLATTDSGEAEIKFAEFLLNGREIRSPRPDGLTVAVALDDYFNEHVLKHCADAGRQEDIITHLKAFFGDRALRDVNVPLSQDYAAARRLGTIGGGARRKGKKDATAEERQKARAGSNSTIRRELNVLVAAANHALWMGRKGAVAVMVDLPPERRLGPDDEAPYYTRDELARIFLEAEKMADEERMTEKDNPVAGEIEDFIKLLYLTGARRRSIENLERFQVKVAEKRILLQKPGKRTTKKRQPIVPILKSMEGPLGALLARGRPNRLFGCVDFYRAYVELCRRAGIDAARAHPHIMRHTRATHLLQDGKTIFDVAKLLGDTMATLERVYGHHSAEHLATRLEDA